MPYTIQSQTRPIRHPRPIPSRLEAVYALICARSELPIGSDPYDLRICDESGAPVQTNGISLRQWARSSKKDHPNG